MLQINSVRINSFLLLIVLQPTIQIVLKPSSNHDHLSQSSSANFSAGLTSHRQNSSGGLTLRGASEDRSQATSPVKSKSSLSPRTKPDSPADSSRSLQQICAEQGSKEAGSKQADTVTLSCCLSALTCDCIDQKCQTDSNNPACGRCLWKNNENCQAKKITSIMQCRSLKKTSKLIIIILVVVGGLVALIIAICICVIACKKCKPTGQEDRKHVQLGLASKPHVHSFEDKRGRGGIKKNSTIVSRTGMTRQLSARGSSKSGSSRSSRAGSGSSSAFGSSSNSSKASKSSSKGGSSSGGISSKSSSKRSRSGSSRGSTSSKASSRGNSSSSSKASSTKNKISQSALQRAVM